MIDPSRRQSGDLAASRPRRGRWQVGLRTLFLLVMTVAVWMAVVINRREIASLEARVAVMRPLAHELVIDDPGHIAVVQLDELWMDENRWDVYLPAGGYRLCMATRGVLPNGLVDASRCSPLPTGRHRLAMDLKRQGEGWRIRVLSDGAELLAVEESKDWGSSGFSSGGSDYSVSSRQARDQPLILYRRRYHQDLGQGGTILRDGPADGLLMWIEPVAAPGG